MNKAITDGLVLTPAIFANGLDVYSSGDGTAGSDTYANAINAAFIPADQDFGGALELIKTQSTQKLRYMGQTPLLPGCYLRITAKIKAISGNLPAVRIAGYPALGNGSRVGGLTEIGSSVQLSSYGDVVEVSAIVGSGQRSGVDMVWGTEPVYGHFGLDLTGPNGGVVRIDDLQVEDITSAFLVDMLAQIDVRDFGAVGDGVTDDTAAFNAANAASAGRRVLISKGTYFLNGDVTFDTETLFEGKVTMPATAILQLRRNFDLPNYIDAFESEEIAFRKAYQALLNNSDHESLDMGGRKIYVTGPIDMQAATPERTSYATRRIIRNGQFEASSDGDWDTVTVTSNATYTPSNARTLTNVTNIANVPVGALVSGGGVGREIYVRSKNVASKEITLNAPLYDAAGTQNYSFSRFQYMLDFSNYGSLSKFVLSDIEIQCNNVASGVNLAPSGITFHMRDCFVSRPKDRGVTSIGGGCQGMFIDRCQFLSSEDSLNVADRKTIGINCNANDVKIRDNRATRFRHFALIAGQNNIITGNHFFQGDTVINGIRSAGLIIAAQHTGSVVQGNYIDNCFIEWTNEQDQAPDYSNEYSFSSLAISGNIFLSGEVAPWFSYIVIKPHGSGHVINGLTINDNRFRSLNGWIDRVERIDTSFADMDFSRMRNIEMTGNSFHGVTYPVANPVQVEHSQSSEAQNWTVDISERFPFGGWAIAVDSITMDGPVRNASNVAQFTMPYVLTDQGPNRDLLNLVWSTSVKGSVFLQARMDKR
ncbi:glycosyl hydrolase family 28-related protein [Sulfitobacter sp. CW3]|uniref:glycosyl hydrolase family 28-related protein n=1 Tax=Sulfitobacter sp. CW3 TaxID=2861965 RepID=UPI001C5D95DE|nr:glycosyl hydrolase family 28-related protein [Sulfitobacter sp. CW3]MBW4961324.1 right-handed parallel beta-helix repeat-containing protein [Sulfitobacter sp. CW3]